MKGLDATDATPPRLKSNCLQGAEAIFLVAAIIGFWYLAPQ